MINVRSLDMKYVFIILLTILPFRISLGQYQIQSPYLNNPDLAIGYVDSCARFWFGAYDDQRGGYFSDIDKYGNPILDWGGNKHTIIQSRDAYGFTRAFMLTGDTTFLNMAEKALDFLYTKCWDSAEGGWVNTLDINGNVLDPTADKSAYLQHYAILGPAAYSEATRQARDWDWLMSGYSHLEEHYWDRRADYLGYFDYTDYQGNNPTNKSFNATVDAVTTHTLYLYLMTEETVYEERLNELADEMINRLAATMPDQVIGFAERYDSDWNVDQNETMTIMGHLLKTAWCLARINQLFPHAEYVSEAESLFIHVYENGYDQELGGPYKDYDRTTGEMLMWGNPDTTKAFWQLEQAVTAGLQLYDITRDTLYLKVADETLVFYMTYFVDHEYSEVYADRTRYGDFAWNENKGSSSKGAYHSIELGYYVYLYGNLFIQRQPVTLHYYFKPTSDDREFYLSPLAASKYDDLVLGITGVLLDSSPYYDYNPYERVLKIPANTGGHFTVTFDWIEPNSIAGNDMTTPDIALLSNYPNPFNAVTTIEYRLTTDSEVELTVYNMLGQKVGTLINGKQKAGFYKVRWEAQNMASGVYLYSLNTKDGSLVRKMLLVK